MVRKRTSSYHKTQCHCFVARQSTTKLTQRQVPGVGSTKQWPMGIEVIFSQAPHRMQGSEKQPFHFTTGREAPPLKEKVFLRDTQPAPPPGLSHSPVSPSVRSWSLGLAVSTQGSD